jgi:hypothetical protein
MKKRTKITLRTKIYSTIVGGLLALAGIVYASNPAPFSTGNPVFPGFPSAFFPTGVAASPDLLLVTPFCTEQAISLACDGTASVYATFPGFGSCREKYMAVAPGQSSGAGFTPRDVFATEGALVFKVSSGVTTLFAALPGCIASDHNGITFDHVGTFGFDMIVTCNEGNVFRVHGDGTVTHIATLFPPDPTVHAIEGPAVVPALFGPHGGEIWVADEEANAVHTIGPPPTYTVTLNLLSHFNPEGLYVIPSPPCAYCGNGFYLSEQQETRTVYAYPLTDFTLPPPGLGGKVLITSESGAAGADTDIISFDGLNYVQTSFAPRVPGVNEGSSMIDCDIPSPTPTTTPTATFTPTATATATFTPTPTATATFTPTPTATATFTPTPTPTPTGTPGVCPLTQGYWKNHPNAWPVNSLMLGSQTYTKAELLTILNTPVGGDASLNLAHQLIAAKLNIAAGSDPTPIASTITHADNLLAMFSGKLPYHVASSSTIGQMMVSDANTLDNYNNGRLTQGCSESRGQQTQPPRPAPQPRRP